MSKIAREVAESEVTGWLDEKKVGTKKRELHKEHIENLIDSIMDGILVLKDGEFIQTLKFPLKGEADSDGVATLKFKQRVKVETVQMHLQGVKANDNYGMINGYIAALTTQPKTLIKAMDTEDYSTAYGIAIFFM
jgi:hypothetical protein